MSSTISELREWVNSFSSSLGYSAVAEIYSANRDGLTNLESADC